MAQRIPKGVKQRDFAQKLIDQGKSRMQVVEGLVSKMNMTKGYATTMVYRWFMGNEFKRSKPEIKAAPKAGSKSQVKRIKAQTEKVKPQKAAKAPGAKKAVTSKKPKPVPSKKDLALVKPKKSAKKSETAAERTTRVLDDAEKVAKKKVAASKSTTEKKKTTTTKKASSKKATTAEKDAPKKVPVKKSKKAKPDWEFGD